MDKKALGLLFLLLIVLASEMGMPQVEAKPKPNIRKCSAKSRGFKGICFSDQNCALVCRGEGFFDGKCVGFRRRCFCSKPC